MSEAIGGNQTVSSDITQADSGNQTESAGETNSVESGNQTVSDTQQDEDIQSEIDKYWDEGNNIETDAELEASIEKDQEAGEEDNQGEVEEETPEPEDVAEESPPVEDTLTVNYLGKQLSLSRAEAVKLAQRGMNAGRIESKYEQLKPLESLLQPLSIMAEIYGNTTEEMIKNLGSIDGIVNTVVSQHMADGMDEPTARELASAKLKAAQGAVENARLKTKQETQGHLSSEKMEQISAFSRLRPDVHESVMNGAAKLPPEVITAWESGASLAEAYLDYEASQKTIMAQAAQKEAAALKAQVKKLEKDLKTLNKNNENRKRAPSGKQGVGGGVGDSLGAAIDSEKWY